MVSFLTAIVFFASSFFCYSQIRALRRNIAAARSSGFTCVILPLSFLSVPWALAQPLLLPLLNRLPERWTEKWLPLLQFTRGWHYGYEPFRNIGADTFIAVSPGHNILYTCDPEAITQFFRGSNAFGKPAELLNILNVHGPTMTGTDGEEARLYRKITAPFFTEQTMHRVWNKSLNSTEVLCRVLMAGQTLDGFQGELRQVLARMTLDILNSVCFEGDDQNCLDVLRFQEQIPSDHQMSYFQAMHTMLDHFTTIFFTPIRILNSSPFQVHKKARQGYFELRRYMEELRDRKRSQIKDGEPATESSLLDLLVRAGEPTSKTPPLLPAPAILGNIFIFMFAGHEANANTLTFLFLLLACHPCIQRNLQADISRILNLNHHPPDKWSYERTFPLLMESHVGAVINETLRLFTVIPFIPKSVGATTPQSITVADQTHVIPANTLILIDTSAAHRHPKFWPGGSVGGGGAAAGGGGSKPYPVNAFNPAHWLQKGADKTFLRPTPGSFIPFSDGQRGCLGRRFGLVELCAVVTRFFSEYSVELIVEEDGELDLSTEGIETRGGTSEEKDRRKRSGWERARRCAEEQLSSGVEFDMSLRLTGKVPVAFVKRGEERFADL